MNTIWKLQDAKARFSKIVSDALKIGPQFVTRRGQKAVVVLSTETYETLTSNKPAFKDFLLSCPKLDGDFALNRQQDMPRSIDL